MKIDVIMPQLGESIAEGTIIKWLKSVGDQVKTDDIILEISTDKVDSEIPSPASGVVVELLASEGDTVPVNAVIARIDTEGKSGKQAIEAPEEPAEQTTSAEVVDLSTTDETVTGTKKEIKRFYSPVVKKIAKEQGVTTAELERIEGSGAGGRVTKKDILLFLEKKSRPTYIPPTTTPSVPPEFEVTTPPEEKPTISLPGPVEIIPMDHVRRRIAEHMVMSKHTSAHVTSVAEVDMTRLVLFRESIKKKFEQQEGFKITYTAFFVDAMAKAIKEFPLINSSVDGENIIQKKYVNIGIAVGLDSGLIVPVIKNADKLNLIGIASSIDDLSKRARSKQLKPEDVQGGTVSITNVGTFGNIFGTPIINQPQVAIIGVGAIKKRAVVVNDAIAIRSMMYITLTYDHRIIDGLYGGSFLQKVVTILENYDTNIGF